MIAKTYKDGTWHELSGQKIYANGAFRTLQDDNLLYFGDSYYILNGAIKAFAIREYSYLGKNLRNIFSLDDFSRCFYNKNIEGYSPHDGTGFHRIGDYIWIERQKNTTGSPFAIYFSDNHGTTWVSTITQYDSFRTIYSIEEFNGGFYATINMSSSVAIRKFQSSDYYLRRPHNWTVKHTIWSSVNTTGFSGGLLKSNGSRMLCVSILPGSDQIQVLNSVDGENWNVSATIDVSNTPLQNDICFLEYLPTIQKWVIGYQSGIYISTNETGTSWVRDGNFNAIVEKAKAIVKNNYLIFTTANSVLRTDGNGNYYTISLLEPEYGDYVPNGVCISPDNNYCYTQIYQVNQATNMRYVYFSSDGIIWSQLFSFSSEQSPQSYYLCM